MRSHLRDIYLTVDPRSLGLFRIALGCTLLLDVAFRASVVDVFYSNEGLLPNHTLLWAPGADPQLSFFFSLSSPTQAAVGMALCALVFAAFTVGYRTRLSHALSLVCLISLNHRLIPLENGGDVVLNALCTFSLFLPLGARFSVDALRASLAGRREQHPAELADRDAIVAANPLAQPQVVSLAVLALLVQLAVIYGFNVVHKSGPTWLDGSAVYYALHQDRLVSGLGVWLRTQLPIPALQALTWAALGLEGLGALAVLSPVLSLPLRALAIALLPALHLFFAACLDLGVFSFAMASFFPLLLHRRHWEGLRKWLRLGDRPSARRVVYFDVDCGICFALARLAARLDTFQRLTLVGNDGQLPEGIDRARVQETLLTEDVSRGRVHERSAAVAEVIAVLPGGRPLAWLMRLPGLQQVLDLLYDRVARNRGIISGWLGFGVCGLPRKNVPSQAPMGGPESPMLAQFRRARWLLAQGTVGVLMLACSLSMLNTNAAVPQALRIAQPVLLADLVGTFRLYQSWSLFAPDAPVRDFALTVEAVTQGGRTVDPYNEVASRVPGPLTSIPPLGNDQFFTAYSLLLPYPQLAMYRGAFQEWLLAYPKRTGRPQDTLERFVVYQLSDRTPPPGSEEVPETLRTEVMRYPPPR